MAGNYNHYLPKKIDLKPKRHHGMVGLIFVLGFFVPPLAIAVRFGIGHDFWINVFLCICGYFPSHAHNFYVQNVRNNSNKRRTPKWAIRYGLVDDTDMIRKKAKSAWAGRYDERNPNSTLDAQEYEEGQVADVLAHPTDTSAAGQPTAPRLWDDNDVEYYQNGEGAVPDQQAPNKNKWHYPANFEGTGAHVARDENARGGYNDSAPQSSKPKKKSMFSKKSGGGAAAPSDADVPEWGRDYGAPRRSRNSTSTRSLASSSANAPEDAWGSSGAPSSRQQAAPKPSGDGMDHQF